uniref:AB hydrolase-1 domain-containing protein n=1 Tax=Rhabditophanes sp. KR3021 TaxID=114890 RepID=A0AC35UC76_9BILA
MLTNDIKEVIDKLGVKKASVIGHDWGSIVAWSFGIYYPEMVEKLVIMDVPHPVVGGKYYQSNIQQFLRAWYIFFFQFPIVPELSMMVNDMKLLETMFRGKKGGIINRENFTDEDMAVYKYTFGQKGSLTYPINFYRGMLQRWSLIDFPKTLVQPDTLIIWGEKDHFVNSEMAQLSAKYCKNATVKLIPNSSHWVQQDSPVEVNNAMRAFLTAK